MTVDKYNLINYFDVWGNQKDGYEVNNLCNEGTIELEDYTSDKEIVEKLKEFGFFADHVRTNMINIWNDYEMIEIYERKTGKPICRLELVRE